MSSTTDSNQKTAPEIEREMFMEEGFISADIRTEDEIYIDYSQESLTQALKDLENLRFSEQMAYISRLETVIEKLGKSSFEFIPKIMDHVKACGGEMVNVFLLQLIPVSHLLISMKEDEAYGILKTQITDQFLRDQIFNGDPEQRANARTTMGKIAPLLSEEDRNFVILPVCLNLVHDDNNKNNKVSGLRLLGQLTPLISSEFLESYVTAELVSLSQDPSIKVKSESIAQMANIGAHIDQAIIVSKLFPELVRLCNDSSWEVRKAFIDNCVILTGYMPAEIRSKQISSMVIKLLNDKSRWVKESAYKQLGKVLALQSTQSKNDSLFNAYIKVPKAIKKMGKGSQIPISLCCAQTIPGVLKAFGPQSWKKLKELYFNLMKLDYKIQVELAKNVHQLGQSVDKKIVEGDIMDIMSQFLASSNSTVKQEAITHLATFLEVLPLEKREMLADVYATIQSEPKKWRVRKILAKQTNTLSKLFSDFTFQSIILPLIFNFCKDDVATVRETACRQIHHLIRNKKNDELSLLLVVEQVKSFSDFKRFTWRQAYLVICERMMDIPEIFEKEFMTRFCTVAHDRVVSVRITAARVLRAARNQSYDILQNPLMQTAINDLINDESLDVRRIIIGPDFDEELEKAKISRMKSNQIEEMDDIKEGENDISNPFDDEIIKQEASQIVETEQVASKESGIEIEGGDDTETEAGVEDEDVPEQKEQEEEQKETEVEEEVKVEDIEEQEQEETQSEEPTTEGQEEKVEEKEEEVEVQEDQPTEELTQEEDVKEEATQEEATEEELPQEEGQPQEETTKTEEDTPVEQVVEDIVEEVVQEVVEQSTPEDPKTETEPTTDADPSPEGEEATEDQE